MTEPFIIKGGLAVDDRGQLSFVNDFQFLNVKRFYSIQNHSAGFIRAWHGHKHEAKYFYCSSGAFVVGAVKIDDWENPKTEQVNRFVLSAKSPCVLFIPAGYANGLMCLETGSQLMVFSTTKLEDSLSDDIRFPARRWNPWTIEER